MKEEQKSSFHWEEITAGLVVGMLFTIGFYLLGYSGWFGLMLGAIGGFAGGWIVSWWDSTDEPAQEPPPIVKKTLNQVTKQRQAQKLQDVKPKPGILEVLFRYRK